MRALRERGKTHGVPPAPPRKSRAARGVRSDRCYVHGFPSRADGVARAVKGVVGVGLGVAVGNGKNEKSK